MNNNLRVLKLFIDNKDKTFTIKKAAEHLKINYKIVYEEIMKLQEEHLITVIKQGNANVCSFAYRYSSKVVEVEQVRKQKLCKNKDIQLIYKRISEVKTPFYCLILFGSFANNTNKKGSDIDLCLITDDQKTNRDVKALVNITPLNIHLQEFSSEEFRSMLKSKEFNVGNEIVKNNIVFHGLEQFFAMVDHVKQ